LLPNAWIPPDHDAEITAGIIHHSRIRFKTTIVPKLSHFETHFPLLLALRRGGKDSKLLAALHRKSKLQHAITLEPASVLSARLPVRSSMLSVNGSAATPA
jgi:hypothetical protein